jgi:hypothetical protein
MAYDETIVAGTTSKIIEVCLRDSTTGQGKTGLAHSAVTARYVREGGTATTITLSAGTAGDSYSSGKWAQVDEINMRGVYQFHVPNAALASGARAVTITFQAAGTLDKQIRICLVAVDQYDAVRAGLTALPNVAADAVGGLPVLDAASTVPANVTRFGGVAGTFAGGRPEVNVSHWGGTAVGSANVRANIVQVAGQTASAATEVTFPEAIGTSTLDAAGVRSAVGLASANLDTQLSSIPTAAANATAVRSELTTELNRIDVSISSRLPTASYIAPPTVAAIASEVDTVLTAAHGSGSWQTGTGGGTDWTADERTAIRTILGIPNSGTTPVIPTEGVLDAIKDKTDLLPTFPANFAALGINASGHISRVTLVDTTTTNTDMRGTDGALTSLGTNAPANWINAAAVASGALNGKGDWALATTLDTRIPSAITITSGRVNADVTHWRGTQPGNLDANGFVPANAAAVNGNTTRANVLSAWLDGNRLDVATSTLATATAVDALPTAAEIWANATRTLTSGANIVLAKGTGVTGFNDLDAAGVRAAVGLVSADLDAQLANITEDVEFLAPVNGLATAIKAKTDQLVFENNRVNANATATIDQAAINTIVTGTTNGVVTNLGSARVTVRSPLSPRGQQLFITPGDDYYASIRDVPVWTEEAGGWPTLTGATITLAVNNRTLLIPAQATIETGSNKQVRVEMAAGVSAQIREAPYELYATLPGPPTRKFTLAKGMVVLE